MHALMVFLAGLLDAQVGACGSDALAVLELVQYQKK